MQNLDIPDSLDYLGDVYRPPHEAHAILLQASIGCSHNACTFCSGYLDKRFALKSQAVLERDLLFAARYCLRQDRVFVLDGNALAMPMSRWQWLLQAVREQLPWVSGAGAFATGMDIARKSDDDLALLRSLGLDRLYVGVESGDEDILRRVNKGIDPEGLLRQCLRAKKAGMELKISVLLGIADRKKSAAHARATGELLSAADPAHITVMTLIPHPATPIHGQLKRRELTPPDERGILQELKELLLHTHLHGGLFDYSHSSAFLSFCVRLPDERRQGLEIIDRALAGNIPLRENAARHI